MEITQPIAIIVAAGITAIGAVVAASASKIDWNAIIKRKEGRKEDIFSNRELYFTIGVSLFILVASSFGLVSIIGSEIEPSAFSVLSYMLGFIGSIFSLTFCIGMIWNKRP